MKFISPFSNLKIYGKELLYKQLRSYIETSENDIELDRLLFKVGFKNEDCVLYSKNQKLSILDKVYNYESE